MLLLLFLVPLAPRSIALESPGPVLLAGHASSALQGLLSPEASKPSSGLIAAQVLICTQLAALTFHERTNVVPLSGSYLALEHVKPLKRPCGKYFRALNHQGHPKLETLLTTYSLYCSSFLGSPCRILHMNHKGPYNN